jgi:ATP-dependent RNA helicase DDX19/DBP5
MPVTTTFEPDFETYLHRIGRCGRFGKIGMCVFLLILKYKIFFFLLGYTFNLIGSEKDFDIMKAIEQYFAHTIDEITIDDISNLEQHHE